MSFILVKLREASNIIAPIFHMKNLSPPDNLSYLHKAIEVVGGKAHPKTAMLIT